MRDAEFAKTVVDDPGKFFFQTHRISGSRRKEKIVASAGQRNRFIAPGQKRIYCYREADYFEDWNAERDSGRGLIEFCVKPQILIGRLI